MQPQPGSLGNSTHLLNVLPDGSPDIDGYSTSANTRRALAAAIAAGNSQVYSLPAQSIAAPNPQAFKVALMADPLVQSWQVGLPAVAREDMKLAAIADNWGVCQSIYSELKAAIALPEGAAQQ